MTPGGVFYGMRSADHWSDSKGTMSHVYKKSFLDDVIANKGGLFEIKVASCCRVGRGGSYKFHAIVNATEFMAYKSSPKASIFPLLTLGARTGSATTVHVRASSADGEPLKFNWTSGKAMCNVLSRWSRPCKNGNDLGASLNSSTGEITWMTNAIGLFAMQVVVYNPRTQSATVVDFLVKTIDGSTSPRYCNSTGSRCVDEFTCGVLGSSNATSKVPAKQLVRVAKSKQCGVKMEELKQGCKIEFVGVYKDK